MRHRTVARAAVFAVLITVANTLVSCSTLETPPPAPAAPLPPIVSVPHPAGTDLADIRNLFFDKQAPTMDSLKDCDADFRKLQGTTQSRDELGEGIHELVRKDPVYYHWCFYSKILTLESTLKGELYVDERQKLVLNTYEFLVPLARVFLADFRDSRYLRWAIFRYQRLSEWVFFRRVEPSPKETEELVNAANPLGLVRGGPSDDKSAILDRYNIGGASGVAAPVNGPEPAAPAQASAPAESTRAPAAADPSAAAADPAEPFQPFSAIDPAQEASKPAAPAKSAPAVH